MANKNTFYITTTLPYVNANPHLGHAVEFVRADIIARHQRLIDKEVFFNTGTDEHGLKIYQRALEEKKDPQAYVDEYAERFKKFCASLNISYTKFIRTTDKEHVAAAQEFWKECYKNGYIYKKLYKIKYCVGCELEKTDSELIDGKCPIHSNRDLEIIEEENYFFKFSAFQEKLLDFYKQNPDFILPLHRMKEIVKFVEGGLQDFSISRLKEKMPWGVPAPGDDSQIMYVWFDALVNYISTIGWPDNMEEFEKWWPVVQIAGKDNLRQQSAMWQAMLLSVGLPPSKKILINGFITNGGQKMSKSLGNVIDPLEIIGEYNADALRYYLAREVTQFEDSDFTRERFKEAYNANLANGLGNLVSRVLKMAVSYKVEIPKKVGILKYPKNDFLDNFEIQKSADAIWTWIKDLDQLIEDTQPFKKIKTDPAQAKKDIQQLLKGVYEVALALQPFMPQTAEKILSAFEGDKVKEIGILFPRKD